MRQESRPCLAAGNDVRCTLILLPPRPACLASSQMRVSHQTCRDKFRQVAATDRVPRLHISQPLSFQLLMLPFYTREWQRLQNGKRTEICHAALQGRRKLIFLSGSETLAFAVNCVLSGSQIRAERRKSDVTPTVPQATVLYPKRSARYCGILPAGRSREREKVTLPRGLSRGRCAAWPTTF